MENQKPLANIVEIKKKNIQVYIPETQASDPDFNPELKGEVTITITARIDSISNDLSDDLFNFKRIIKVVPTGGFLSKVKSAADVQKEKQIEEEKASGTKTMFPADGDDPMYDEARKIVMDNRKCSASLLQRKMKIGFARAAQLVDKLEENGVVAGAEGAKDRKVLVEN